MKEQPKHKSPERCDRTRRSQANWRGVKDSGGLNVSSGVRGFHIQSAKRASRTNQLPQSGLVQWALCSAIWGALFPAPRSELFIRMIMSFIIRIGGSHREMFRAPQPGAENVPPPLWTDRK